MAIILPTNTQKRDTRGGVISFIYSTVKGAKDTNYSLVKGASVRGRKERTCQREQE
jgi:hypothetical protein